MGFGSKSMYMQILILSSLVLALNLPGNTHASSLPSELNASLQAGNISPQQMCPTLFTAVDEMEIGVAGGKQLSAIDWVVMATVAATFAGRFYDYLAVKAGESLNEAQGLVDSLDDNGLELRQQQGYHRDLTASAEQVCGQAITEDGVEADLQANMSPKQAKALDKLLDKMIDSELMREHLRKRRVEIKKQIKAKTGRSHLASALAPYFKKAQIAFGMLVVTYYVHLGYQNNFSSETLAEYAQDVSSSSSAVLMNESGLLLLASDRGVVSLNKACFLTMKSESLLNDPEHIIGLYNRYALVQSNLITHFAEGGEW